MAAEGAEVEAGGVMIDIRGQSREKSNPSDAGGGVAGSGGCEPVGDVLGDEQRARSRTAGIRDLPAVLTGQELARLLRLRPRSVYEAIRRHEIPGVRRIGRKVRVDRDTIVKWLADVQGRVSRSPRRTQ
jgi:excisionase family DNA binding protein